MYNVAIIGAGPAGIFAALEIMKLKPEWEVILVEKGDKIEQRRCLLREGYDHCPTCKKCGAMISDYDEAYCIRCKNKMYDSFEYGFSLLRYNEYVKESLHKVKYSGRKEYLEFYGKCIAKVFYSRIRDINPDCFIPVPIHKKRLVKRSYNQAATISYVISDELKKYNIDIPVNENIIFRKKNTVALNKLSEEERKEQLSDAFFVNNNEGIKKVIIVDDIFTTGGTIDEMAKVLKKSGVKEVYFLTIAMVDNL